MTGSEPATSTRERILDIALDLFTVRGYAGTSLREIAEALGVSKAALYYHFPSKQDILLGLHVRVHGLTNDVAPLLASGAGLEMWDRVVGELIGMAIRHRRLLALHFKEQTEIAALHQGDTLQRHGDIDRGVEEHLLAFIADPSTSVESRVRRLASLGTVVGALISAGTLSDVPDAELERILREVAADILRPGRSTPERLDPAT